MKQRGRNFLASMRAFIILACSLGTCFPTTTCLATEWCYGVDENPQQIGPNAWHFTIDLGLKPAGRLHFVSSQYDFAWPTEGIDVDYDFSKAHIDFSDDRVFYAIAPTLFDDIDGYLGGWSAADMKDGIFSGVVYATAPLTTVYFGMEADHLVPVSHRIGSAR